MAGFNIDYQQFMDALKLTIFKIAAIPLQIMELLPEWVKVSLKIIIGLIVIYLAQWCYRHRDDWITLKY